MDRFQTLAELEGTRKARISRGEKMRLREEPEMESIG
jgi:hypothetical protein